MVYRRVLRGGFRLDQSRPDCGKVYRLNLEGQVGQVGDDTSKGTLTDPDLADRVAWVNSLNMTAVSYNSFVSHDVNGANNDSALYKAIRTGAH